MYGTPIKQQAFRKYNPDRYREVSIVRKADYEVRVYEGEAHKEHLVPVMPSKVHRHANLQDAEEDYQHECQRALLAGWRVYDPNIGEDETQA